MGTPELGYQLLVDFFAQQMAAHDEQRPSATYGLSVLVNRSCGVPCAGGTASVLDDVAKGDDEPVAEARRGKQR